MERIAALYPTETVHVIWDNLTIPFDSAEGRWTAFDATQYGLSFHSHTGRWEKMPFVGELVPLAHDLVTALGPYLERADFPGGIRGSGH